MDRDEEAGETDTEVDDDAEGDVAAFESDLSCMLSQFVVSLSILASVSAIGNGNENENGCKRARLALFEAAI